MNDDIKYAVTELSKKTSSSLESIVDQQRLKSKELLTDGVRKRGHNILTSFIKRN